MGQRGFRMEAEGYRQQPRIRNPKGIEVDARGSYCIQFA